ncbi:type VI secretion system baseplate subunit TssF [Escherichia coli]|nr:hypothetical protein [Escherichia coli]
MEFEERYFREELDYLRQLSKLLATEKPHLARFLAEKDADPDIERLLEGVAFLTGNLRQKIEDEFPELTHGLIKMLWPNYLRPVPAMTLIEYTPDMDKSSVPVLIPRNEQFTTNAGEIRVDEVLPSDAKKEEPPPCTFTLCRDIWLLPVRLEQIENRSTTRNGVINITFSVAPGTDFRTLDLNKLRFWLGNDDNYTRDQLYLWFCEYLQGADLTVASPELENYERRLQQLLDTSPVQPLETGMQMMRVADSRWPESLQQQQASTQWNEALKTRAQSSPQLRGWLQTRQDLHAFADLVMQREKEGLTLSYIKNVIWQAERGLGQETPVESLLTQYHDARAQKQNTDALEKQINERLEGVLSRWLLLKNNVMPEAATGTTAEK